ncbi:hypothetical protein [Aliigemmobacter aestuarii]|uniref:hypothetical protein n=1 Tax=Aliigemmobacter aestuarii TaxID=1445661 RepID=UPI001454BDEC|nr:hypothetical protein [Gemmobacter aestuarii]
MNPTWLLRMKRWVRNPPSGRQVRIVAAIVAAGLVLAGIEWLWGWPDWFTVNNLRRP